MAVELGAKNGYIVPDQKVLDYVTPRAKMPFEPVYPDDDANYESQIEFNLDELEPQVACPHTVDNVHPVSEVKGEKVNMAFLGTCANARLEDLQSRPQSLRAKRSRPGVRFQITPASQNVYLQAVKDGTIATLIEAGGIVTNFQLRTLSGCAYGCPGHRRKDYLDRQPQF